MIEILLLIICALLYLSTRRPPKYPPGPPKYPILGSILSFRGAKKRGKVFQDFRNKYGNIYSIKIGGTESIVLSDYNQIKDVFSKSEGNGRPHRARFGPVKHLPASSGVVMAEGEMWAHNRRFTLRTLRDFGFGKTSMEDIIKDEIKAQLATLREDSKDGNPVKLDKKLNITITNIIWKITAGDILDFHDDKANKTLEAIDRLLLFNSSSSINMFPMLVKFLQYLPEFVLDTVTNTKQIAEPITTLINYQQEFIDDHKESHSADMDRDFIDVYLSSMKENEHNPNTMFNDYQLTSILNNLFTAGGETTATTLRWAFSYLIRHPDIQNKLQQEIDDVIGRDRLPELSDRPKMHYTDAVINETGRMASIVPLGIPRRTISDVTVGDYVIPKDTNIFGNLYWCHHDPDYWEQPSQFNPERFLENGKPKKHDAFMPFSTGKRQCLGENLASSELFLFLTSFMQQFTFLLPPGVKVNDADAKEGTIVHPPPYTLIIKDRY